MNEQNKNEANKTAPNPSGSGSDTVSAAKAASPSASPASAAAGSSGGAQHGGKSSAQSSTLASHTSKPMGGTGGTGASHQAGQRAGAHTSQSAQGMADQAKRTAGQAQEKTGEMYEQASDWARDTYEDASDWASDAYRRGSERLNRTGGRTMRGVRSAGSGVQHYMTENPVMVGLIGLAAGLLIGSLLPRTRREDETFGEWADDVREQGMRYAHEAAQYGREFVDEHFAGDDERFAHHESEFRPRRETPIQEPH